MSGNREVPWSKGNTNCTICKVEFGFFTRKHHCRYCGAEACSTCTQHYGTIEKKYYKRICSKCWDNLKQMANVNNNIKYNPRLRSAHEIDLPINELLQKMNERTETFLSSNPEYSISYPAIKNSDQHLQKSEENSKQMQNLIDNLCLSPRSHNSSIKPPINENKNFPIDLEKTTVTVSPINNSAKNSGEMTDDEILEEYLKYAPNSNNENDFSDLYQSNEYDFDVDIHGSGRFHLRSIEKYRDELFHNAKDDSFDDHSSESSSDRLTDDDIKNINFNNSNNNLINHLNNNNNNKKEENKNNKNNEKINLNNLNNNNNNNNDDNKEEKLDEIDEMIKEFENVKENKGNKTKVPLRIVILLVGSRGDVQVRFFDFLFISFFILLFLLLI